MTESTHLAEGIIIKSSAELALMRQAGHIVASVLQTLAREIKPGLRTKELDSLTAREVARLGASSSFLGYRGFPANLCVSVNDEIVHGIPGERLLRQGDIVSLDFGAIFQGFQADAAVTVPVGKVSPQAQGLLEVTQGALRVGISAARSGGRIGDISAAIQDYAESHGFSVVREYSGHGIGRALHEEPQVANFGLAGHGLLLRPGMTLAIEPMVNIGGWQTRVAANHWTVLTADGSLSAHFEHTIAITDGEAEVLTEV
jgi:methionyl aminopeptidase